MRGRKELTTMNSVGGRKKQWSKEREAVWCVIWGGKFIAPHYHFIHDIPHGSLQLLTKGDLGKVVSTIIVLVAGMKSSMRPLLVI